MAVVGAQNAYTSALCEQFQSRRVSTMNTKQHKMMKETKNQNKIEQK